MNWTNLIQAMKQFSLWVMSPAGATVGCGASVASNDNWPVSDEINKDMPRRQVG